MSKRTYRKQDALSIVGKDYEDLIDELEEKERLERRKSYADQLVMKSFTPRELARYYTGLPMHEPRAKGRTVEVVIDLPSEPFEQGPSLLLKSMDEGWSCPKLKAAVNRSVGLPAYGSDLQVLERSAVKKGLTAREAARGPNLVSRRLDRGWPVW